MLGNLDQLDARAAARGTEPKARFTATDAPPFSTAERARRPPTRRHARVPWWAIVIVVIVLGGGAWAWNHKALLSALLPQTQLNSLLTRAGKAYTAGKLVDGPASARDLYEAAQALDPDNEQALTGLQNVGGAELKRAQAALQQRNYSQARSDLEEARSLLGGGSGVAAVQKALAKAVLQSANVDVLIGQARAALANGRIDGATGAAALFGKVLAGDPTNPIARHGMDQIGNLLANRVQSQLGSNNRAGATQTLSNLASLLPGYSQLPSLRAQVAAADRAADAQRDQYLTQGEADLRAGKATGSGSDNAEAAFKAALAIDPSSARAQAGLGQVAEALILQANAAMAAGHRQAAGALLDRAAKLAPKSADLAAARSRLAEHATGSAATATPALTPAQSAKLAGLLKRAKAAARAGNIMLPPGNSAYDLYRAALAVDGNSPDAQAGLRGLPQITRNQFAHALHAGNLDRAHDMLATLDQLDPGDPAAARLRKRLGRAWLDRASHDANLGNAAAARTALQEARRLVPQDPRISEVDARIQRGD